MIFGVPYDAEVEYLQANNSMAVTGSPIPCVIDIGIVPNIDTDIWECDAQFLSFGGTAGCWGRTGDRFAFGRGSASWTDWYFGLGDTNNRTSVAYDFKRHVFRLDGPQRTLWVDARKFSGAGNIVPGYDYSLAIFNRTNAGGPTYVADKSNSRCYSSKYYRNGALIQHLIPVRITNEQGVSEGAMYDRVTHRLFRNAGTGNFVIGPDVAKPVMGLHFMREPLTAKDYIQDGLIAMWDGIENAGWGIHDANATVWKNLVENSSYADFDIKSGGTWTGNGFAFNGFAAEAKTAWPSFNNLDLVYQLDSGYVDFAPNFRNRMRWFTWGGGTVFSGVANVSHKMYTYPYFKYGNALIITTQYSGDDISKLYVNGSFVEPTGQKTQSTSAPNKSCIGYRNGVSSSYNTGKGEIWRIAVYSRALTSEEVAKNHAIDKARFNLNGEGA